MMIQVKQGYEPLNFTGHFQAWDRDVWSVSLNLHITSFGKTLIPSIHRFDGGVRKKTHEC